MIARVIVQKNSVGEKHITLTQDFLSPIEDFLVTAPGWDDSEIVGGKVLIFEISGPEIILDELLDVELHSAWTKHNVLQTSKGLKERPS